MALVLESTETSIEKARAQGQWAQASVELEEWVTAGRQLVDAQLPWVQSSGSAGALQSASANPVLFYAQPALVVFPSRGAPPRVIAPHSQTSRPGDGGAAQP